MPDVVLVALIVAPVLVTYFFKSNAALAYLALCVGFVLSTSVIGDLKHLLSETNLSITNDTLAMILIALPFLMTLVLSRHGTGRGAMFFAQLLVALLGGGLLALSAGPLINSSVSFNVLDSSLWTQLQKYQSAIIGAGSFISLALVWLGSGHHSKKH